MDRLQCVGKSSKLPSKDESPLKPEDLCSGGIVLSSERITNEPKVKKIRPPNTRSHTVQHRGMPCSSVSSNRSSFQAKPNGSGDHRASATPGQTDVTAHVNELSKHCPPSIPASPGLSEAKPATAKCVEPVCETERPLPTRPACVTRPDCLPSDSNTDQSPRGGESEVEEVEEEYEEDEVRAPLELLAEFLQSVMKKDYLLARKLCKMVLVYEPQNPEAKLFLPLLEEKLLLIAQQEEEDGSDSSSEEEEGGDDTEDEDGDRESSEEDVSDSCDSDGESTEASDNSSSSTPSPSSSSSDLEEEEGRGEEDYKHCRRAPLL